MTSPPSTSELAAARKTAANVPGRPPLRTAMAQLVKELVWRFLIRFSPRQPPIGLYASRRSGSTLLMETICVNKGVMFSDQPFCLYTASSANLNRLPIFSAGQIAFPDPAEELVLEAYVRDVLSGRVRANVPWKLGTAECHLSNHRLCLKITDAKALIEWMAARFQLQTVVMTRHPVAQALSVSRLGWLPTGKGLLRNGPFVERWLNDELENYCWDVYRGGDELACRVLDWALENLPMLSLVREHREWFYLGYEDLVGAPQESVRRLCRELKLDDPQRMVRRLQRRSRSTGLSAQRRREMIRRGDREQLLNGWQAAVGSADLRTCFEVLSRFEIDLYRADSSFPDHQWLGRSPWLPAGSDADVPPGAAP